nr:AAA family ATPase [Rhizobium leguminosarum]
MKDFRSVDGEVRVSLDAPIVLVHGPNGAGKTSLLSAIEMGLTGAVPSLSRAEPDYLAYLPHKDRPFGDVRVEVETATGDQLVGEMRVTADGVVGTPVLGSLQANFFSERSYLAQSTLGRLLEIYQHSDKRTDSPLTRFVKELLGLDRMEAIIGGLHSAGNIMRLRTPVPSYDDTRAAIAATEKTIDEVDRREASLRISVETLETEVREILARLDPALSAESGSLQALLELLPVQGDEESDLMELARLRRDFSVLDETWNMARTASGTGERLLLEAVATEARNSLHEWIRTRGHGVEALLQRAGSFFADLVVSSESGLLERGDFLRGRIGADVERIDSILKSHEAALRMLEQIRREAGEARARLLRLDEQFGTATDANEALAKMLFELSTHIHDDLCPVCDRNFSEVSTTPLSAHVAAKVSEMLEHAGRLQSLSRDRTSTSSAISSLERRLSEAGADVLADEEFTRLKMRLADLSDVGQELSATASDMQNGDDLRNTAAASARNAATVQSADQSLEILRRDVAALADRIVVASDPHESVGELLQRIRSSIDRRENVLNERGRERRTLAEKAASLDTDANALSALGTERTHAISKADELRRRRADADGIIETAKDLVRKTREAKGKVVRKVFNDELNALWRDLFVRLAPEEPFIPAFAIPDVTSGDIEAVLETHHRHGGKGGNPRAMLSAGNLNTAALTLFLALHLSVKPQLPWLVIDDPVQSMDEVHIAQFAALIRTLSKQMGRQIVLAVHERSLFDYLSLELSPAFPGDRLNVIELGRSSSGQTTCRWNAKLYETDRAIAA